MKQYTLLITETENVKYSKDKIINTLKNISSDYLKSLDLDDKQSNEDFTTWIDNVLFYKNDLDNKLVGKIKLITPYFKYLKNKTSRIIGYMINDEFLRSELTSQEKNKYKSILNNEPEVDPRYDEFLKIYENPKNEKFKQEIMNIYKTDGIEELLKNLDHNRVFQTQAERDEIEKAIQLTKKRTSGEIRYIFTSVNEPIKYLDGKKGGYIESEENLPQIGNSLVLEKAHVVDKAKVTGTAVVQGEIFVRGNAIISGNAIIHGKGSITDNVKIFGDAVIDGDIVTISDNVKISGDAIIRGEVTISDKVVISGNPNIQGKVKISDNVEILGNSRITGKNIKISGDAIVQNASLMSDKGYDYKDKTYRNGTWKEGVKI